MDDFKLTEELHKIWETRAELELKLLKCQCHLEIGTTVWFFSAYITTSNSGIRLDDIAIMKGVITDHAKKGSDIAYEVLAKCWEGEAEETICARDLYLSKELAYKAWLDKIIDFERLSPDE